MTSVGMAKASASDFRGSGQPACFAGSARSATRAPADYSTPRRPRRQDRESLRYLTKLLLPNLRQRPGRDRPPLAGSACPRRRAARGRGTSAMETTTLLIADLARAALATHLEASSDSPTTWRASTSDGWPRRLRALRVFRGFVPTQGSTREELAWLLARLARCAISMSRWPRFRHGGRGRHRIGHARVRRSTRDRRRRARPGPGQSTLRQVD